MSVNSGNDKDSDTPVRSKPIQGKEESGIKVKCGNKIAMFFPSKLKRIAKGLAKCIKYNDKWLSPSEFESVAGLTAKKWKQSIKCEGVALGEWLSGNVRLLDRQTQGSHNLQQSLEFSCNTQQETELSQELRNVSPGAQQQEITYTTQLHSQSEYEDTHNIQQEVRCSGPKNIQQDMELSQELSNAYPGAQHNPQLLARIQLIDFRELKQ